MSIQAIYKKLGTALWALAAAGHRLANLQRGTEEYLEWAFIKQACQAECRRLNRQLQHTQKQAA